MSCLTYSLVTCERMDTQSSANTLNVWLKQAVVLVLLEPHKATRFFLNPLLQLVKELCVVHDEKEPGTRPG